MADTGRILILTGSTGAGKSTACSLLVDRLDGLWLHFGIDLVLGKLVPRKFIDGGRCSEQGVHSVPDNPENPDGPWHLDMGRYGMPVIRSFHRMAAAAVRDGQNLVIDHIATLDPPILQDCVSAFAGLPVWFVALKPPPETSPRRIDQRLETLVPTLGRDHAVRNSEAKKRIARWLHDQIFAHDLFDQVIDTDCYGPEEVASRIIGAMGNCDGSAFPALARRLST
jgi:chloramphenicol 3-O-phosphotransferase